MSWQRSFLPIAAVVAPLLAGCSRRAPAPPAVATPASAQPSAQADLAPLAVPVKTAPVQRQTVVEKVRLAGTLAAERKATIAAQVSGRVVSVAVSEGSTVRAGDLLLSLYDGDARLRVASAEAEVRRALQRASSAQTDAEIVVTDTGAAQAQAAEALRIAQARLEQARSELRLTEQKSQGDAAVARADLAAAQARLRLVQAGTRREEIDRARAETEGAKVSVASAQRDADQAKREWERRRELGDKDYIPRRDVENAEEEWQQAKAKVALAQSRLSTLQEAQKLLEAGPRPEEVAQAQAQVQAAMERARSAEQSDAALSQKQQEVAAAEAQVSQARKALEAARKGGKRVRKSEQDAGALRSDVEVAQANLSLARADLAKLQIRAPMAGTVTTRDVDPGEAVQPGQALLALVDPASLYLDASVSDRDAPRIRLGQTVDIRFEALRGRAYTGRVQEILSPRSPQDRSFHLKIALQAREPLMQAVMLATASSTVARHENVLAIPAVAFLPDSPDSTDGAVYIVEKSLARRRAIAVGAAVDGLLVVRQGLAEGDLVVVDGQAMLKDGRPVQAR